MKMCAAAGIMAIALMVAQGFFEGYYTQSILMKTFALSSVIGIGMAVYAAAVLVLRAYDAGMITKLVRKRQ